MVAYGQFDGSMIKMFLVTPITARTKNSRCDRRVGQIHVPPAAAKHLGWRMRSANGLAKQEIYLFHVDKVTIGFIAQARVRGTY